MSNILNILVIEDNEGLARLISNIIKKEGYNVNVALNGKDAMDIIFDLTPDLIFLDYFLVDETAKDLINEMNIKGFNIPFIIMTGQGDERIAVELMKLGARDYLVKDMTFIDTLPSVLNRIVKELVTEEALRQAEQRLRDSEEKYRLLIEKSSEIIYTISLDGTITSMNPAFDKITGWNRFEFIGKQYTVLLHPDDIESVIEMHKRAMVGEVPPIYEHRLMLESGEYATFEFSVTPIINDDGEIIGRLGFGRDITGKKQNEELKQKLEIAKETADIKEQFLANMNHEMRTPMSGILGMSEFLLKTKLNKTQQEYAEIIRDSSITLMDLITAILDVSKIDGGFMKLHFKRFNFKESVYKLGNLFLAISKQKNIPLTINYPDSIPSFIIADKNRLIQIMTNLISNAFTFSKAGKIEVNFSLINLEKKKIRMRVEVIDQGMGISKNDQKFLFDKFSRVDNSFTRLYEGAGLGLTIAKGLVELMKGEIGVKSQLNKGSNFWFTFEAEYSEADLLMAEEPKIDYDNLKLDLNVLLVEDRADNQKVADLLLKHAGCNITLATDGHKAIELFDPKIHNLILLDIYLPKMDGFQIVNELRKKYDKIPPVIALTASTSDDAVENYIAAGMDDYLPKPVDSKTFYDMLIKWKKLMSFN
ncbi:MAG: response regulator [Bacteroidota bacterium]|nr:response regulator [Bacteroidota bacterium]